MYAPVLSALFSLYLNHSLSPLLICLLGIKKTKPARFGAQVERLWALFILLFLGQRVAEYLDFGVILLFFPGQRVAEHPDFGVILFFQVRHVADHLEAEALGEPDDAAFGGHEYAQNRKGGEDQCATPLGNVGHQSKILAVNVQQPSPASDKEHDPENVPYGPLGLDVSQEEPTDDVAHAGGDEGGQPFDPAGLVLKIEGGQEDRRGAQDDDGQQHVRALGVSVREEGDDFFERLFHDIYC